MKLQEHIDSATKQVRDKIKELGLEEAAKVIGVNRSYVCRVGTGNQVLTTKTLIEFANRLGLDV